MLFPKNLLVATFLIPGLGARTAGSGLSGGGKKPAGESENDDSESREEDEADEADEPQQVAGSWLVSCDPAPDKPAAAGHVSMGCKVFDEMDRKVKIDAMSVTCHFKDGSNESPTLTMEPEESPWTATFALTEKRHASLASMDLTFEVGGVVHQRTGAGGLLLPEISSAKVILAFTTFGAFKPEDGPVATTFVGSGEADEICREAAERAKLGDVMSWRALLSASGGRPFEILYDVQSARVPARIVSAAEFWTDGGKAFQHDENGREVDADAIVWTGLTPEGSASDQTCDGWAGGVKGLFGNPFAAGTAWYSSGATDCTTAGHLYCVMMQ